MKILLNLFVSVGIVLSIYIGNIAPAHAHPLDNTDTYIYVKAESDSEAMDDTEIVAYVYINWLQSSILVEELENTIVYDPIDLLEYQSIYETYVDQKLAFYNNGNSCANIVLSSPVTEDQISLSLGTRVIIVFKCEQSIENLRFENRLFTEYFEAPSNFVSIFTGERLLHKFTLGSEREIYEFNVSELVENPRGDESVDLSLGLATDEILSRDYVPKDVRQKNIFQQITDLLFLRTNEIKNQSLFGIIFLVFMLGLLHTLEAGHSKAILASSMVNKRMNIRSGLAYSGIFTLTHLADIVIVGILFVIADSFLEIFSRISTVELWAGYTLLVIATYIMIKNAIGYYRHRRKKLIEEGLNTDTHKHDYSDTHTLKEQLMLGFLTGLAPCIFGWSIFMLVLSTGQAWWLFPVILAFGAGIFVALAIVVFIIAKLRNRAYGRFEKFAEISPLLSGIFLFIYALIIVL